MKKAPRGGHVKDLQSLSGSSRLVLDANDQAAGILLSGQGYSLLDIVAKVKQVDGSSAGHAAELDFVPHFTVAPETRIQSSWLLSKRRQAS